MPYKYIRNLVNFNGVTNYTVALNKESINFFVIPGETSRLYGPQMPKRGFTPPPNISVFALEFSKQIKTTHTRPLAVCLY